MPASHASHVTPSSPLSESPTIPLQAASLPAMIKMRPIPMIHRCHLRLLPCMSKSYPLAVRVCVHHHRVIDDNADISCHKPASSTRAGRGGFGECFGRIEQCGWTAGVSSNAQSLAMAQTILQIQGLHSQPTTRPIPAEMHRHIPPAQLNSSLQTNTAPTRIFLIPDAHI